MCREWQAVRRGFVSALYLIPLVENVFEHLTPFFPARRHVVRPVPRDLAGPAQGHDPRELIRISAGPQRWFMVRLKRSGPAALGATPVIPLEGLPAHGGPA